MRTDLLVLVGILGFALLTMPFFALSAQRGRADPLESTARGDFVLGSFVRSWFLWFIDPVVRVLLALGVSPTALNLTGVAFGVLGGLGFATGHVVLGGWAVLAGGVADVLDGRVARARGLVSPRGAFLDSTLDRFAELGAFVGLAILVRDSAAAVALVATALGGSLLVSYARARGESVGVVCKKGVMQRAERLLLLGFGGILDPAFSSWLGRPEPGTFLVGVLGLVAVGTVGTAVFRTVWIAGRLGEMEGRAGQGPAR